MSKKLQKAINLKAEALLDQQADEDEFIKEMRFLIAKRDKLADEIVSVNNECDALQEILRCSSEEDVQQVIAEFYQQQRELPFEISPAEKKVLKNRVHLLKNYNIQKQFGISVRTTDDNFILIEFSQLPNYSAPETCLIRFAKDGKKYKLNQFILPDLVPVGELEERYLVNPPQQDVPAFLYSIQQCLWCYWTRDFEIVTLKKEQFMQNSVIYHNKNRTVISFTLHFMAKYCVEINLRFDPTSYLPYSIEFLEREQQLLPHQLQVAMMELRSALLDHPVTAVLRTNLSNRETTSYSEIETSSTSLVLDLFK